MARRNRLAFTFRTLAAVCLFAISGCATAFDNGVIWLPDSSGFIYTGLGNTTQIRHFDPAARKSRVVVEDTKAPTYWPAVSPNGKQIAVARVVYAANEKDNSLQITRYDMKGKALHRSPALPWHTTRYDVATERIDGRQVGMTRLFWSPQGDRLLVNDCGDGGYSWGVAIYDVATDRLTPLTGHLPVFGGTPFRPDGKAFVLWRFSSKSAALVDMQGKEQPITLLSPLPDDSAGFPMLRVGYPGAVLSRWEGNTGVVLGPTGNLRIDTAKRALTLPPIKPDQGRTYKVAYVFPDGGAEVRAVSDGSFRLEVLRPGAKQPKLLAEDYHLFVPSPDQKWLALRGMSRGSKILVIDRRGDVIAELPN